MRRIILLIFGVWLLLVFPGVARSMGPEDVVEQGIASVDNGIDWLRQRRTFNMNGVPYGLTGMPIVFYTPSSGFHYGGWIEVANYKVRPYRYRFNAQWWLTTEGMRNHHIRVEAPRIWRLPVSVRFLTRDLKNTGANFFGIGNDTEINQRQLRNEPDYYRYLLEQQRTGIDIETNLFGGLSFFCGLRFNRAIPTRIDQTKNTYFVFLMPSDEVPGREAGWSNFFAIGLILDKRNDEEIPTEGTITEFSMQNSYGRLGSDYRYKRYTLLHTNYLPLRPKWVMVNRLVVERLSGMIPFYEMTEFGGSIRVFEIGESASLRGYESRRFADRQKAYWTTEFRRLFKTRKVFGQYLLAQASVFTDVGRVAPKFSELRLSDLHYDVGAGFRVTWNTQLSIRTDYAVSPEDRKVLVNFGLLF